MSDSATEENLMAAFISDSQASMKYHAFATAADREGLPGVARLFRAAAESEKFHAWAHLRNAREIGYAKENPDLSSPWSGWTRRVREIGDARQNLQAAVDEGTEKVARTYPGMIAAAEKEGQDAAAAWLRRASKAKKKCALLCERAIQDPKTLDGMEIRVCPACGCIVEGDPAFEKCPVCDAPLSAFHTIR